MRLRTKVAEKLAGISEIRMVGAVGIEFAQLSNKSHPVTALAAPIKMNWCQMVPSYRNRQQHVFSPVIELKGIELSGYPTYRELATQRVASGGLLSECLSATPRSTSEGNSSKEDAYFE